MNSAPRNPDSLPATPHSPSIPELISREIQRVAKELATTLTDLNYNNKEIILSSVLSAISEEFDRLHPDAQTKVPVPLEVLELANREFNESEVLADLREIRESGGLTFNDFYPELEKLAEPQP